MIDFSLGPKVSGEDYLGPLHALELGRQAKSAETQMKLAQQRQVNQQQVLQRYSAGDTQGAQQQAFASGDFDLAKHLSDNDETHRKALAGAYDTIGAVSMQLKGLPVEQRAQAFAQVAPMLKARGVPDQVLQQAGGALDDASLDGYISSAQSVSDQIKRHDEQNKPVQLSDGASLINPTTGATIASNEKDAKWQFDQQSGSWLQEPGTGGMIAGGVPSAAPSTARPSGSGSSAPRSVRNNNPGNIEDGAFARSQPGYTGSDGRFATFANPGAGAGAQAVLLGSYIDRGHNTVAKIINRWAPPSDGNDTSGYIAQVARALNVNPNDTLSKASIPKLQQIISRVEGGPGVSSGVAPAGHPGVVNVRPPKQRDAPSGFQYKADGRTLEPIPGGPADSTSGGGAKQSRAAEVSYRKEFDQLPEVKTFKTARQQFQTLKALGTKTNPTAQDDIAMIFGYMKTLDPTSVVREGEFANAQNAAGVPDTVRNAFNKALNGTRLNPQQRKNMVASAYENYKNYRDAYNQSAENYRGYARDSGVNPDHVARTYTPDKPQGRAITSTITRVK